MIIQLPNGETAEFPDGMDIKEIESVLQKQFSAPAPTPSAAPFDPMAESLGMFQPEAAMQEAVKLGAKAPTEIGMMIAPLAPGAAALPQYAPELTKAASIARAMPYNMALAGMGASAANLIAGKRGEPIMQGETPDIASASIGQFNAPLEPFGVAAESQATGMGVMGFAEKLFAPAVGKMTEGAKSAMSWMKAKGFPYSADVGETTIGKVSQKLADWGLGGFITNSARQKAITGISEEATKLSESLGLQSLKDAGSDLAQTFAGWGDMKMTYSQFNNALDSLPLDKTYTMFGLKDAIKSISKTRHDEVSTEAAVKVIKRIYKGEKGSDIRETLLGIIDNNWEATAQDIKVLSNNIRKGGGDYITSKIRPVIDRMKEGFMDDIGFMMTPEGKDIGKLRDVADKAMTQAYRFLEDVGEKTGLVFKDKKWGKWTPTFQTANVESGMQKLFRPDYEPILTRIKDNLTAMGDDTLWDSIKLAYLKDVFDSATPVSGKLGERIFKPQQYLDWYKNNATYISKIMPEHMDNINLWADISRFALKDFTRAGKGGWDQILASSGLGTLGFLGGRTIEALSVPLVFSPLAAIFTMSPRVNFLTRYATKHTLGPMGNIAAESAGLGSKIGMAQLLGGEKNAPVIPGSNLSFAPNVDGR